MLIPKRTMMIGGALVAVLGLYSMGSEQNGASPTSNTQKCKVSVTADVLNVRATPDGRGDIVGKFKQGAQSDAENVVQNGFRKLGENRWASAEFLKPVDGHNCG